MAGSPVIQEILKYSVNLEYRDQTGFFMLSHSPGHKGDVRNCLSSLYRGSYMSAHVVLNLLKELRKSDKMQGLSSILLFFSQQV